MAGAEDTQGLPELEAEPGAFGPTGDVAEEVTPRPDAPLLRRQRKSAPPKWLLAAGAALLVVGLAAVVFLLPKLEGTHALAPVAKAKLVAPPLPNGVRAGLPVGVGATVHTPAVERPGPKEGQPTLQAKRRADNLKPAMEVPVSAPDFPPRVVQASAPVEADHTPAPQAQSVESANYPHPAPVVSVATATDLPAVDDLRKREGQLEEQLKEQLKELEELKETVAGLQRGRDQLLQEVSQLRSSAEQVGHRISTIEAAKRGKAKQAASHHVTRVDVANRPPFELRSVEVWGSDIQAVVTLDGQMAAMSIRDSRLGWELESVDIHTQEAKFLNLHTQKIVTLRART